MALEAALATAETAAELHETFEAGGGASGPAARRALLEVANGPRFEGREVTRNFGRQLKELRTNDAEELAQLRADVQGLVRAVYQLSLENQQLRTELAGPRGRLRVLPAQPRPPAPRGVST